MFLIVLWMELFYWLTLICNLEYSELKLKKQEAKTWSNDNGSWEWVSYIAWNIAEL